MVRDEIKKALLFKLKKTGGQEKYNKDTLDAFNSKAEEVINTFEQSMYTDTFKQELKSFKEQLVTKSMFEKFLEKTSFLVPFLFSLFFIRIIYKLDIECKTIKIFENYIFELSFMGIVLIIWFIASLIFVFKK